MKINCIIVDDEPLAIKVIKNHLSYIEGVEIVAECKNAIEAGNILRKEKVDLIFLDIQMPKVTGFDFLSTLDNPPKVIITTAFRNYAIKSYEFEIVDYLLKPIPFERFLKAVNKFFKQNSSETIEIQEEKINENLFIYVNEEKNIHKIFLTDIIYIESFREYINIHTKKKSVSTKIQISKIYEKLSDNNFIRIHKSFIVAVDKISSFNAHSIITGNKELPIGRTYKEKVIESLNLDSRILEI